MRVVRMLCARLLEGLLSVFLMLLVVFALARAAPGDPAEIRLQAGSVATDSQSISALREELGLDRSLPVQFSAWVRELLGGYAGRSLATDRQVIDELSQRLPWSFAVGVGGVLLGLVSGAALGFAAQLSQSRILEAVTRLAAVFSQAVPAFAFALVLYWLLVVEWHWLRPVSGGTFDKLLGPIVVVAIFSFGSAARVTVSALEQVAATQWFLGERAKGFSREQILWRYGRRYVALALIAIALPEFGWALGGTAVSEAVFGVPGVSIYIIEAAASRDYTVVQIFLLIVLLWLACCQAVVAALLAWLDPRPRNIFG